MEEQGENVSLIAPYNLKSKLFLDEIWAVIHRHVKIGANTAELVGVLESAKFDLLYLAATRT